MFVFQLLWLYCVHWLHCLICLVKSDSMNKLLAYCNPTMDDKLCIAVFVSLVGPFVFILFDHIWQYYCSLDLSSSNCVKSKLHGTLFHSTFRSTFLSTLLEVSTFSEKVFLQYVNSGANYTAPFLVQLSVQHFFQHFLENRCSNQLLKSLSCETFT